MTGQAIADFVGWVSGRGAAARPTPAGRQAGETHTACALRLIEAYGASKRRKAWGQDD
jgi:hypothetical protein